MSTQELLALMRLLSALESWSFSAKTPLPDYLHDSIDESVKVIEREVLRDCRGSQ